MLMIFSKIMIFFEKKNHDFFKTRTFYFFFFLLLYIHYMMCISIRIHVLHQYTHDIMLKKKIYFSSNMADSRGDLPNGIFFENTSCLANFEVFCSPRRYFSVYKTTQMRSLVCENGWPMGGLETEGWFVCDL